MNGEAPLRTLSNMISDNFKRKNLFCAIPVAVIRAGMKDRLVIHAGHRGYRELEAMTGVEWHRMAKPWLIRLLVEYDSWTLVEEPHHDSD